MIVSLMLCSVKMTESVNRAAYPFMDIQFLIKGCMLVKILRRKKWILSVKSRNPH